MFNKKYFVLLFHALNPWTRITALAYNPVRCFHGPRIGSASHSWPCRTVPSVAARGQFQKPLPTTHPCSLTSNVPVMKTGQPNFHHGSTFVADSGLRARVVALRSQMRDRNSQPSEGPLIIFPGGATHPACFGRAKKVHLDRLTPFHVFFAGGIYFWWQAGAVKALQELYNLDDATMAGASAGSLSAVLAGCGVDMDHAFELATRSSSP